MLFRSATTARERDTSTSSRTRRISEESSHTELGPELEEESLTELDNPGFDAEAFVQNILSSNGLPGVLRVEADLVSQIRNLDSDRKSLVYDNYSKLLAATSTIRRMLGNMDPLTPTTNTLAPAISHIAETAAGLSAAVGTAPARPGLAGLGINVQGDAADGEAKADVEKRERRARERETVRWVLDTPRRLRRLLDEERVEEARKDWDEISATLEKWTTVAGAEQLRLTCEAILNADESESGSE